MSEPNQIHPIEVCEGILRSERHYNVEHEILQSENTIIDRLLSRRLELVDAYSELHSKLAHRANALEVFLGVVVRTAAFWNPDEIDQARAGRERLKKVNQLIAMKAAEVSSLLHERSQLHDHSGFSADTHYHVCGVVEEAAADNCLFDLWVKKSLRALRGQFDLKYWPSLSAFMRVVAEDAEKAELQANDPVTAAATGGMRASLADFFKALLEAIEENRAGGFGSLPRDLKLTDNSIASLANCALDLSPDDVVDGAYVKRLRQREREIRRKGNVETLEAYRTKDHFTPL